MSQHADDSRSPQEGFALNPCGTTTSNGNWKNAHVLFLDVVAFTKRRPAKQILVLTKLQEVVKGTREFTAANENQQLIALPTGDGMALVFMTDTSGPATSCAESIAEALVEHNKNATDEDCKITVRMGIHTGNIVRIKDVNDRDNVAGEGINTAQRVMDCGDVGHILLSNFAVNALEDDLNRSLETAPLGKIKVKHDQEVDLYSLIGRSVGNGEMPQKVALQLQESERWGVIRGELQKLQRRRRRLQWVIGACVLIILAGLLVWAWARPSPPPSFAVLPFQPESEKDSSKAVSKGLAEELDRSFFHFTTDIELTPLDSIKIDFKPTSSSPSARQAAAIAAAREHRVQYVLTGIVESKNNDSNLRNLVDVEPDFDVVVQVELYDTLTGKLRWRELYERKFGDLIGLQKEIVREVTSQVGGKERAGDLAFERIHTDQSKAHWRYLLGRFWSVLRQSAKDETQARELTEKIIDSYQKAIESDQRYALAYAGLADIYASIGGTAMHPAEARNHAVAAAQSAQDCNEGLAEVYAAIGTEKWWLERDFSTARMAFQFADKINPKFADNHRRYSNCLAALGGDENEKKARAQIDEALRLEPDSLTYQLAGGMIYFFTRKYDEAIRRLKRVIQKRPEMYAAYRFHAMALAEQGYYEVAYQELSKIEKESANDIDFLAAQGNILARLKRYDEAQAIARRLERLRAEKGRTYVSPFNIAVIYAALPSGATSALGWLDEALSECDPRATWLNVDPRFNDLRKKVPEFSERLKAAASPCSGPNSDQQSKAATALLRKGLPKRLTG